MPRSTLIFGNGLGMSLNPDHFCLDQALLEVWNSTDCLSKDQKALIVQCLTEQGASERPEREDDLDILHRVVTACDYLSSIGEGGVHWLSEHGQGFPGAIRTFITAVAWHFHYHEETLEDEFLTSLAAFIDKTQSHLATLNYDNLLYQELIERQVLCGYNGSLVDGFHRNGFAEANLGREFGNNFGYYMHLHGSPLFVENQGRIIKQRQGESEEIPTAHIVLTHVEHKPSVIDASELLKTYWRFFGKAIRESSRIVLFGYSGEDIHLNRFIRARGQGKEICIIEWSGSGEFEERADFWSDEFEQKIKLQQLDNILDFKEWAGCGENA